jgi:hypothetical protein
MIQNPQKTFRLIMDSNYPGLLSEMDLIAVFIENGKLKEEQL